MGIQRRLVEEVQERLTEIERESENDSTKLLCRDSFPPGSLHLLTAHSDANSSVH